MPLVLAQQAGEPRNGNREAYEGGQKVGQITAYLMFAVIGLWLVGKIFRKK